MKQSKRPIFLLLIVAFILRIAVMFVGYHGDLNNQISWGVIAVNYGLNGFYEGETVPRIDPNIPATPYKGTVFTTDEDDWPYSAPNQPPLTILLLAGMALLWNAVHTITWSLNNTLSFFPSSFIWFWEAKGMILLMKLPGIFADLGIGILIYKYVLDPKSKILNSKTNALLLSSLWLFNPLVWYNSSIWGQTDSIVNLLGLLSVFALLSKNLQWSVFWFTLSVLFKGSLIYFAPILLSVALYQKHSIKEWLRSIAYCLVPIALICVWFHPTFDLPIWLYDLYTKRFIPGEIGYLTANAFNFWWIVDSGKTYDSILYSGIPARIWGFILPLLVIIWQIYELRKGITDKKVFFAFAITALTIFLFMTRIHERYLYPFFPYATLLLAFIPRLWIPYLLLSFIHLLNLYNEFWVPTISSMESLFRYTSIAVILSFVTILNFLLVTVFVKSKK